MRKVHSITSVLAVATLFLSGCSLLASEKGFDELADGPGRILQPEDVENAALTDEPFADLGNKSPYSVNGRFYYVMEDPTHYRARGVAAWYGKQFHGRQTSSGEAFDMYAMSAAHRNLPLPTYLEVTNLDNGKVAIVRTNDRGPFVDDRLIDVSYAAAVTLGMADAGTANVEVRAITGDEVESAVEMAEASAAAVREAEGVVAEAADAADDTMAEAGDADDSVMVEASDAAGESASKATDAASTADVETVAATAATNAAAAPADSRLIQIGAFSRRAGADAVREAALAAVPNASVQVLQAPRNGGSLYRVRVGPVATANIDATRASLAKAGFDNVAVFPVGTPGGDCVAGCL